jgi:hypothetical protein
MEEKAFSTVAIATGRTSNNLKILYTISCLMIFFVWTSIIDNSTRFFTFLNRSSLRIIDNSTRVFIFLNQIFYLSKVFLWILLDVTRPHFSSLKLENIWDWKLIHWAKDSLDSGQMKPMTSLSVINSHPPEGTLQSCLRRCFQKAAMMSIPYSLQTRHAWWEE